MRVLINLRYICPILLHKEKFFVTDICPIITLSAVSVEIIENRDLAVKYKI